MFGDAAERDDREHQQHFHELGAALVADQKACCAPQQAPFRSAEPQAAD